MQLEICPLLFLFVCSHCLISSTRCIYILPCPTDCILYALHASTRTQIEELAKIIYTPVVGRACQSFAHIFRRTRGMYFSSNDRDNMASMVYNWPVRVVDLTTRVACSFC
jgi:hypothetical protein